MRPVDTVRAFLDAAAAHAQRVAALRGAAMGLGVAATLVAVDATAALALDGSGLPVVPHSLGGGLALAGVLATVGAVTAFLHARRTGSPVARAGVAREVERRTPQFRNLLVTADELHGSYGSHAARDATPGATRDDAAHGASPDIVDLVTTQAASRTAGVHVASLFPVQGALRAAAAAGAVLLLAIALPDSRARLATVTDAVRGGVGMGAAAGIARVDATVLPPAYTGRSEARHTDPVRVEALAGSRLRLTIRAGADSLRVTTADDTLAVRRRDGDTFETELRVTGDGFVAIEAVGANGATTGRRLVGITAAQDAAPRVRIVAPARDLVLRDSLQTIALTLEADDDIALAGLRLRYTKVSGSGERFTFVEGEVPLEVTRANGRTWRARVSWNLAPLTLGAGDMVVYRGVANDRRPGAAPSESDAFIAQRLATDGAAALGFAVDPDEERQALSQQMVIVKTERLIAQQRTLTREAFIEAARLLGAEQRRVRAEFVFMMGGEMAEEVTAENSMGDLDESHEAESESDLSAGRMENQGRTALLAAIRAMSRAAGALTDGDPARALPHERSAVANIERAFARSRYLLRALTQREQLDLTRRGTGELAEASRSVTPAVVADPDARVLALRGALAELVALGDTLARAGAPAGDVASRLSLVAERMLRTDASSPRLQAIARDLDGVSRALAGGRQGEARRLLDRAASATGAMLRSESPGATRAGPSLEQRRLRGALSDRVGAGR